MESIRDPKFVIEINDDSISNENNTDVEGQFSDIPELGTSDKSNFEYQILSDDDKFNKDILDLTGIMSNSGSKKR